MQDRQENKDFELLGNSPDDPRLRKKWGYIAALPSEYLIHFRNGKIRDKSSGQGASCFKWMNDTVFIIPTSLKEIIFQANQLTVDNVDVRIRGMAVYRIHEPRQIYNLINFSNRQRAEEKLARMICDMCRSTSKWLVANMKLSECIRKRKEEIAESLKKEVALVVSAKPDGWGVEIVTIDIQDIYIQDLEIFNSMQMIYKSEKVRESKTVELETKRELESKQLEIDRYVADQRKENQLKEANIDAEVKEAKILLTRRNEEKQFELDKYRIEQNEEMANYKLEQGMERDRKKMLLNLEKTQKDVEAKRISEQQDLDTLQNRIRIENSAGPASLERSFMETALPKIAQAMAESMKNLNLSVYQQNGEGATPFNFFLAQIMQIVKNRMAPLREEPPKGS